MDLPRRPSGTGRGMQMWTTLFPFLISFLLCPSFVHAAPQNITLDDTSPRITYTPASAWLPGQNCGTPGFDCRVPHFDNFGSNKTWHYGYYNAQNNTGSLAAELTFNGTAVSVFGVIATGPTYIQQVLNFIIDGNTMGVYSMPGLENEGDAGYGLPFFHSPNLTNGEHKLRVETQGGATESLIMLDRFVFTQDDPPPTSTSLSSSTTSSQPTSTNDSSTNSSSGTINTPVVAGIVAGVVVLVLLIAFVVFIFYRKRYLRRKGAHDKHREAAILDDDERTFPGGPTLVQPYPTSTPNTGSGLAGGSGSVAQSSKTNLTSPPPQGSPERRRSTTKGAVFSPSSEHGSSAYQGSSTAGTSNLDNVPVEEMMRNLAARGVQVPGDTVPPAYASL